MILNKISKVEPDFRISRFCDIDISPHLDVLKNDDKGDRLINYFIDLIFVSLKFFPQAPIHLIFDTLMYKNYYNSLDFEATILKFSTLTCMSSQVAVPLFQFPPFWGKGVGGKEVP